MRGNRKFAWLYVVLTVIVSVGAVIFQRILENSYLDRNGLYQAGIITPEIFVVYAVLSALLILTVVFSLRFDIVPKEMKRGTVNTAIVSVLAAIALVYTSITFFMGDTQKFFVPGSTELMVHRLQTLAAVVAFLAALYYMITAFMGKSKSRALPYLSFFPLFWTLFVVMSMYFDRTVLINSPVKSLQQLALVVLMLYQLYEIRAHIGKTKMVANFVLALVSTLFLSAAFVPTVVEMFLGTKGMNLSNMICVTGAVMALYTLSKAIDFAIYPEIDIAKIVMERAREEREKAEKAEKAAELQEPVIDSVEDEAAEADVSPINEIEDLLSSLNAVADSDEDETEETVSEEEIIKELEEINAEEDVVEEAVEDEENEEAEEIIEETAEEATEETVDEAETIVVEESESVEEKVEEAVEDPVEEATEEAIDEEVIAEEATEEEAAEETVDETVKEAKEDDTLKRLKEFFGKEL